MVFNPDAPYSYILIPTLIFPSKGKKEEKGYSELATSSKEMQVARAQQKLLDIITIEVCCYIDDIISFTKLIKYGICCEL